MSAATIRKEKLVPLADSVRFFPAGNPAYKTIRRWTIEGVHGVRLECFNVGSQKFTSRAAVRRFLDKLNEENNGEAEDEEVVPT